MTTTTTKLGKLITSHSGRCAGPRYGVVYTASSGKSGYIAGYRSSAHEGLGLMGERHFATRAAAQDYAVRCCDM